MEESIFDVIDNGIGNKDVSEKIIGKLKEKYDEEFVVHMIGNRYGTAEDNSVTTYCSPKNNGKLIFTATLDKEQVILDDYYQLKRISFEIEEELKSGFKNENIDVIIKTDIVGKNKLEKSLTSQDFINKYPKSNFLAHIVSKIVIPDEIIKKVFEDINAKYNNIHLRCLLYTIDKEKYSECYEVAKTLPSLTTSIIESYFIIREYVVKIFEKTVTLIK